MQKYSKTCTKRTLTKPQIDLLKPELAGNLSLNLQNNLAILKPNVNVTFVTVIVTVQNRIISQQEQRAVQGA